MMRAKEDPWRLMHKKTYKKPDGRSLHLYSMRPIPEGIAPVNPVHDPIDAAPHLRWHPLRGEWVAYASHRQNRTFLPPKDYSPLAVTKSAEFPTEMSAGDYEVAVFENLFPSLSAHSATKTFPEAIVPVRPGDGVCEVVVFTQDPEQTLSTLPVERVELILLALADRTRELGQRESIQYVLPFENRGVEMGVTLHHPHGQLYAYPFVPPVPAQMLSEMKKHHEKTGRGLFEDLLKAEIQDGRRLIVQGTSSTSFVPVCARYPYETWVAPHRPVAFLHDLNPDEIRDLARTLSTTLRKHDALWNRPQPYLMVLFQAPLDQTAHPEAHLHFQIYPPYRTKDRLKYLAGTELGAGMFVNDSVPEEKAAELREAQAKETS